MTRRTLDRLESLERQLASLLPPDPERLDLDALLKRASNGEIDLLERVAIEAGGEDTPAFGRHPVVLAVLGAVLARQAGAVVSVVEGAAP